MKKYQPYPTSTFVGEKLILAYNLEKESHQELQHQIRLQQMKELSEAVENGGTYRYIIDASPQLNKMMDMLKQKGAKLRNMREVLILGEVIS